MPKYAITGGYTAATWAGMVDRPNDRMAAVSKLLESMGGRLDAMYWTFGEDDFLIICDAPDDITAAAGSVATAGTGALQHLRTTKLLTAAEFQQVLERAKAARPNYAPPGSGESSG